MNGASPELAPLWLSLRSASLAVLVAPDVPAVLIELGYLSNASDAAQMNKDRWRDGVAKAIADSVDRNFTPQTEIAIIRQS